MTGSDTAGKLAALKRELKEELFQILNYWINKTLDEKHGGFIASLDNNNLADEQAAKGVVLNSRILWTFSAAYIQYKIPAHLNIAHRAYQYIDDFFIDQKFGGVYWSVNHDGKPAEARKQIYGLAFCIYGLSEYYKASGNTSALDSALQLYHAIERHSFDKTQGGYFEAFTQDWKPLDDLRLSDKDDNEKKTMNTHLHIIEAYANLYAVKKDELLRQRIIHLLDIFDRYIINKQTGHLNLFMDENWAVKSSLISYGHDIEAAWLLLDCAEIIHEEKYISKYKTLSMQMANAAAKGLDGDGALWYEYEPSSSHLVKEKHWWPQAEAMVGFFSAWQLNKDDKYLDNVFNSWQFIKQHLKDLENGEWFWGVYEDYSIIQKEKAGFWKCPYHNSRACMELIKRLDINHNSS